MENDRLPLENASTTTTYHLSGSNESSSTTFSRDIPREAFFFSSCSWRFSYKPLTDSSFPPTPPFTISGIFSRSSFWGGDGCVLLRSAAESVTSTACEVEEFRSKGKLSRAISMLACFKSPSRVSRLVWTLLVRSWGCEYKLWLCTECSWSWLTSIEGIGGYEWLSVMSWVLTWLKETSGPLLVKFWRFWSELLFFMPLADVLVTVLGEVTRRICVAGRAPRGVVTRPAVPNVARS